MAKIVFNFDSSNNLAKTNGTLKQNGLGSYVLSPVGSVSSFEDRFNLVYEPKASEVQAQLAAINTEANNIKNSITNLSDNLTTNYLSEATFNSASTAVDMAARIAESTTTFATNEQVGGWYGLNIETDVNGTEYITGFDVGAIADPSGVDSYFRIAANKFIVGGSTSNGEFAGPTGVNGEPIPAFAIEQDGLGNPEIYFNGKVNITSLPESINKYIGEFASVTELNTYLIDNPDIIVNPGDTYLNTTNNTMYAWSGNAWISTAGETRFWSIVFLRASSQPATPIDGTFDDPIPSGGWQDGVPPFDPAKDAQDPLWATMSEFSNKIDYVTNPPIWTEPVIWADSETTDIAYNSSLTQPADPTYSGDLITVQPEDSANGWYDTPNPNSIWASWRLKRKGVWSSWSTYRIKGEDGTNGETGPAGSRGSGILSGTETTSSGFTAAFIAEFGNVVNGDQYVSTGTSSGTMLYRYNNGTWTSNVALTVHGDAIVNGTLAASEVFVDGKMTAAAVDTYGYSSSNYYQSRFKSDNEYVTLQVEGRGTAFGGTVLDVVTDGTHSGVRAGSFVNNYSNMRVYLGGTNYSIDTSDPVRFAGGVTGISYSDVGAAASSHQHTSFTGNLDVAGYIAAGPSASPNSTYPFITDRMMYATYGYKVGLGGAVYDFTGAHTVYTDADTFTYELGDIVKLDSIILATSYSGSYMKVSVADIASDKRVIGIYAHDHGFADDVVEINEPNITTEALALLTNHNYEVIGVNSVGEGGINVCEENGDIEVGDYICSSNVPGKGMKQMDDLLHNYTVGKASESIVWADEVVGEDGCFEFEGVKCKMIACTYHCG